MSAVRFAIGLLLVGGCTGSLAGSQAAPAPVSVVRMTKKPAAFSIYTGVRDSMRTVVRDSVNWRELWARINQPFLPPPPLPSIDFRREMVVVAALGARPTAGYDVVIEAVERDSAGIEVALRRQSPAPGCPVAAAMTQPLDLARIPASEERVRFRERTVVVPCTSPD